VRILVSNDDSIYSPGIATLAAAASEFGNVRVVAPDVEQSSTGHAITASRPLSYRPTKLPGIEAYRVNGTPADCVALGAYQWDRVDVVLAGLNQGLNLGNAIWHSGTLAAAKQAALLGLRGIALSAPPPDDDDSEALKPWIRRALEILLPDPTLPLVNVNFPRRPRGFVWTRVSVRRYDGCVVPMTDPRGRPLYWFTTSALEGAEPGTDRWAIERAWISMTPLRLDLTDEKALAACRSTRPLDERAAASENRPHEPDAELSVREDEAKAPAAAAAAESDD